MSVLRYSANSRLSSSNVPSIKTRGMMGAIVGECEGAIKLRLKMNLFVAIVRGGASIVSRDHG